MTASNAAKPQAFATQQSYSLERVVGVVTETEGFAARAEAKCSNVRMVVAGHIIE
jgi:hypothetical protein